jgi:hypothetical protein
VKEKGVGQERMEGYAGGGQGTKRAVAPLMMMMIMELWPKVLDWI